MRALSTVVVLVAIVLAGAADARADRVIRLGTVGKTVDRAAVETALDGAYQKMAPCFRRAAGATIKVKVAVGSDGEVVSATATGKGGAAQCVAGLLAVTQFPAGAWKGEVQVDAVDANDWLNAALARHQSAIASCQDKDAASKGEVVLQLAISKSGKIASASVEKSGASKAIADCAKAAALRIELGTLPGGIDVKYRMNVMFNGGKAGSATTGTGTGTGTGTTTTSTSGEGGTVKGALAGNAVQKAWEDQKAKAMACGKTGKTAAVTVGFAIRANGTVKNVAFKSSTVGKTVEDCLDKELRALKFPTASGETQVNLPLSWATK